MLPLLSSSSPLSLTYGGYSHAGVKAENQDAFAVLHPSAQTLSLKGVAACVADGASCSEQAQLASQTAVTTFLQDYFSTPQSWSVKQSAARVLCALNAWLLHHGQQTRGNNSYVTTFSALVVKSAAVHLFHVGDTRIYRYRNGQLELLTRDHRQEKWGGGTLLARALGLALHLEIDYSSEPAQPGDLYLLATDGLWEPLSQDELVEHLAGADADLELQAKRLVERAITLGSQDNLTCLLLRVEQLATPNINETLDQMATWVVPPVLQQGMKLDGYEVLRVLYNSPRSHLYLVQAPDREQPLVLKAPSPNLMDDPQFLDGFAREQWVGAQLQHPHIMRTFSRPAESPYLYLLAEHIEGQTLREWMYDHPKPSLMQTRELLKQMIAALRALQRQGMLHRDLKLENFMVNQEGQVKLIDFGTVEAKGLAELGSALGQALPAGALDYMAPECRLGDPASERSDSFSLAAICYEMLTGQLPYPGARVEWRQAKLSDWRYESARNHRADVPVWIDSCLKKALDPLPTKRYAALSEWWQDMSVPNPQLAQKSESAPLVERNPVLFWQLVCAALLVLLLFQSLV